MSDEIHKAELRQHLKDVDKDIEKAQQELNALLDLREWIKEQIETRKSVTLADVRDWLHDCTAGDDDPATIDEIAMGIGCSASQIRHKGYLTKLLDQGTIIKVVSDIYPIRYKFDDLTRSLEKPHRYERKRLRVVHNAGAVPGTGASKLRGRKQQIRKGRRGHR